MIKSKLKVKKKKIKKEENQKTSRIDTTEGQLIKVVIQ